MNGKIKLFFVTLTLMITFIFLFFFNCQNFVEDQGSGTLIVKTPKSISTKAINGIYPPDLENAINNGNIRYEIVIENNGKKLTGTILKNNDSTSISVQAGVRLNVYVGIYFVEPNSNNELINTYFVTDKKENVIVMPNQTIYLDFTLDLNKPTVVECYANLTQYEFSGPAIYEITGIASYPTASPAQLIVAYKNLVNGNFNISSYLYSFYGINSLHNPEGKLFKVEDPFSSNGYGLWYLDTINNKIRFEGGDNPSSIGNINFTERILPQRPNTNYLSLLSRIDRVFSVKYGSNYYFFLLYKNGMLSIKNKSEDWGQLANIDFSNLSSSYEEQPFILDIEQIPDGDTLFASKIGLFYVDEMTLDYFSAEQFKEAVNRLKRLIRIPDPFDKRKSLLITAVKSFNNDLFLGTRYGVYKIDKSSSKWISFANKNPEAGYTYLDETSIEKIKDIGNVIVTDIYTYTNNYQTILIITTNKSIIFYDVKTGRTKEFTVWDGLPFIPARKLAYNPGYSNTDYYVHGISPIKNIVYSHNRFWIATMHGLASIAEIEVF